MLLPARLYQLDKSGASSHSVEMVSIVMAARRIRPLSHVRYLSTSDKPPWKLSKLSGRALYEFKGRDVMKFLQGSITKNINALEKSFAQSFAQGQDSFYTSFLNPQGRVMADAFLHLIPYAREPSILVEVDKCISTDLIAFIKRFKLRSKFQINDVSDAWDVMQLYGNAQVDLDMLNLYGAYAFRDVRSPEMGWRVLLPKKHTGTHIMKKITHTPTQNKKFLSRMLLTWTIPFTVCCRVYLKVLRKFTWAQVSHSKAALIICTV